MTATEPPLEAARTWLLHQYPALFTPQSAAEIALGVGRIMWPSMVADAITEYAKEIDTLGEAAPVPLRPVYRDVAEGARQAADGLRREYL